MIDRNQTKSEDHEDNCFILFHAFATDDWTQASFWTQLQSQRCIISSKGALRILAVSDTLRTLAGGRS